MAAGSPVTARARPGATAAAVRIAPPPERVLVKAVNWLGDLVMSLPALRALRRAFPAAFMAVLVKRELAGFFDGIAGIDEIIPYRVGRGLRGLGDRRKITGAIRARDFDLAVLMPNSFESALWVAAARVPRRAGFVAGARGALLTHKARPPRGTLEGHQVHYWLAMVRETLGAEGEPEDFAIKPSAPNVERMRNWLDQNCRRPEAPFIVVAPAAAYGPAKEWPAPRFAALIDLLAGRHGLETVLAGAPAERAKCEEVARLSRAGAPVAAGETGVGELVALLSLARGFAGNDSGCMHAAAALGIPTVGIFGSTDPLRTGPLGARARAIRRQLDCSLCLARTCRFGHYNCLHTVEPQEVAEALGELGALE